MKKISWGNQTTFIRSSVQKQKAKQDGMAETVSWEAVAMPFLNTSVCPASSLASWPHALA